MTHAQARIIGQTVRAAAAISSPMLQPCHAYLIAATDTQARTLRKVASGVGFGSTSTTSSVGGDRTAHDRVNYFLVHAFLSTHVKEAMLAAVRGNGSLAVCLAPVILITGDCEFETILQHVRLGFDDVIALPEKAPILAQRLESQITSDHLYIRTPSYFGPDRRRLDLPGIGPNQRGREERHAELLTVRRDPELGVSIVHHVLT